MFNRSWEELNGLVIWSIWQTRHGAPLLEIFFRLMYISDRYESEEGRLRLGKNQKRNGD